MRQNSGIHVQRRTKQFENASEYATINVDLRGKMVKVISNSPSPEAIEEFNRMAYFTAKQKAYSMEAI